MKIPKHTSRRVLFASSAALLLLALPFFQMHAQMVAAASLVFPVIGPTTFTDDFLAPRSNGPHYATDIFGNKHQKIVSRTDGRVVFVGYPQPSWGYAICIESANGYHYWYLHLNNDTPGTDDGNGSVEDAYGPDMVVGKRVVKGQLLGYLGDSGNAENTPPHLHFEIYDGETPINPYHGLKNNAIHLSAPVSNYPVAANEIVPSRSYRGGASITLGNVDADEADEIVIGPGKGGYSVKIFEQDGNLVRSFQPNGISFDGGVDVALGDVDGDTQQEIITAAGPGGKNVKIFETDGTLIASLTPNATYEGGISIAAGDVDNDGVDEIITGTGPGGRLVKIFELDGTEVSRFAPYGEFDGGITVTTGDVTGDEAEEIITGPRSTGGPRVNVFGMNGLRYDTFYAYSSSFKGGIVVASANIDKASAKDEILTTTLAGGSPRVKMFSPTGAYLKYSSYFAEEWWRGYYDLDATHSLVQASQGIDRRTSIRDVNGLW